MLAMKNTDAEPMENTDAFMLSRKLQLTREI